MQKLQCRNNNINAELSRISKQFRLLNSHSVGYK